MNKKSIDIAILTLLIFFALIIRIDFNTWHGIEICPDTESYLRVADNILYNGNFIDSYRTPVYSIFLVITYILFGYMNFIAIVSLQSLMGLGSVILLYVLTCGLFKSRVLSFISSLTLAVNYNVIYYDTTVLTEGISSFLTLFTFYVFYRSYKQGFPLSWCILYCICSMLLIFIRPILIIFLPFIPICAFVLYVIEKNKKAAIRLLITYLIIVVSPTIAWCLTMKMKYGFWGFSGVSHIQTFSIVLKNKLFEYAPPEYTDFAEAVKRAQEKIEDEDEANNPYIIMQNIDIHYPQENSQDYRYVMKFSRACIMNKPFIFFWKSTSKIPEILERNKKIRDFREGDAIATRLGYGMYRYLLYKPMQRKHIAILVILFTFYLPVRLFRSQPEQWFFITMIFLFLWMYIALIMFLAPAAFYRYRSTIDPLIHLAVYAGIYDVFIHIKSKVFKQKRVLVNNS